ncbi:hypothetical protein ACFV1L_08420 [Kitasatospora sp. NPDC059646]|uniref:hypothetical protein n=1 Tax=Kitasatospora sp. NPDC059646 TaxID=3346893 RepID=UPI0036A03C0C
MRRVFTALATGAITAALGLATVPAHAATTDVNMAFGMSYGNSTTSGTIHFTDGYTATVSGAVHAASGQRRICSEATNGDYYLSGPCSAWASAGGANQPFTFDLRIALPGGVQRVYLTMYDEGGSGVAREYCTRNGCTRVY